MDHRSRSEAIAAGEKRYFTGFPCAHGHIAERLVFGGCVECNRIRRRKFRRDKSDKALSEKKAAYHADIEVHRERNRKYQKANSVARAARCLQRKAAKRRSIPGWFGEFDKFVMLEASSLAQMRQESTGFSWQVDHSIPMRAKIACGLHVAENIQVIPASLNASKGNRMQLTEPGEWISRV